MSDPSHVRALRNNNPGNIRAGGYFQGLMPFTDMSTDQKLEKDFAVFRTPVYGFRAMAIILRTYDGQHHLNTVRGIISRWAPPSENKTDAYIAAVCGRMLVGPDDQLAINGPRLCDLCKAISTQEVGVWAFVDADLKNGCQLAEDAYH